MRASARTSRRPAACTASGVHRGRERRHGRDFGAARRVPAERTDLAAGRAGIVGQSRPYGSFEETCEKLDSVARFLISTDVPDVPTDIATATA